MKQWMLTMLTLSVALVLCSCSESTKSQPPSGGQGGDSGSPDVSAGGTGGTAGTPLEAGAESAADSSDAAPVSRPNIVFILSDDQRADSVACMSKLHTLIGSKGVYFSNNFSSTSLCCPSRSSSLTGKYAHNHNVRTNADDEEDEDAAVTVPGAIDFNQNGNDQVVVAKWLQQAGYRTAFFGKYLNGYDAILTSKPKYVPPYWDEWHAFQHPIYFNFQLVEKSAQSTGVKRHCYLSSTATTETNNIQNCKDQADDVLKGKEHYSTDVLADKIVQYLQSTTSDKTPFFLYFAPKAPHSPFQSPARYQPDPQVAAFSNEAKTRLASCSLYDWTNKPPSFLEQDVTDKPQWVQNVKANAPANFEAAVDKTRHSQLVSLLAIEDALEALLSALETTGVKDNTIIVFSSDNGYSWGEHWWNKKNCVYDSCSRIPLVAYDPRYPQNGRQEIGLTLNIDLPVTFAELAGTTIPSDTSVNGLSIVSLIQGTGSWNRDRLLLECWGGPGEGPDHQAAARTLAWKYVEHYTNDKMTTIKMRKDDGKEEVELYDLEKDPYEADNLLRLAPAQLAAKGYTQEVINNAVAELKPKLGGLKAE